MLFSLKMIDHEICKVYEMLQYFFSELRKPEHILFSEKLFPEFFRKKGLVGKLKSNFKQFFEDCKRDLNEEETNFLCDAFTSSNDIEKICSNTEIPVFDLDSLPEKIRTIVDRKVRNNENLFEWLYTYILTSKDSPALKLLKTSLDDHYDKFLLTNPLTCPYCGLEDYTLLKTESRTDYDHYLKKEAYPFSTINLANLFPMGLRCNQRVKAAQEIIYAGDKNRVIAFYPYTHFNGVEEFEFGIACIELPSFDNELKGEWKVEIKPKTLPNEDLTAKITTWNRVFNITGRYVEKIQTSNKLWIQEIFEDNIQGKVDKGTPDKIKEFIRLVINERLNLLNLSLTKVSNRLNLIPEHLFLKFMSMDNTLLLQLTLVSPETISKVDMSWAN